MQLPDNKLQNGDHILITDVGLEKNNNELICWINRRIISNTFGWYHKLRTNFKNESKIGKYNGTIGWDSHSWFNVVPHVALTRSAIPATEGTLTCKDPSCDLCSSVSLEVHYPSELCVFSISIFVTIKPSQYLLSQ